MQITNFNPTSGDIGTTVTITLTAIPADADDSNTFIFLSGSSSVETSTVLSDFGDGTVTGVLEQGSQSGELIVVVRSQIGDVSAQSGGIFTVNGEADAPRITQMQPLQATAGQTQLTLTGEHLDEVQSVVINTTRVASLIKTGTTRIRLTVPAAVPEGRWRVYGQSAQYGQVKSPYMLTVAPPANVSDPVLVTAGASGNGTAPASGTVVVQLQTPFGDVRLGEFALDAGQVHGTDQRGIGYRGSYTSVPGGMLVKLTASVPAGTRVGDDLATEEEGERELSLFLDKDVLAGRRATSVTLPGFGAADVRFTVR